MYSTPITTFVIVGKEVSTDTDNLQPAITKVKKLALEDSQKIKRRSAPVDEVRVGDGTLASHPLIGLLLPIATAMNAVSIFRMFTRLFLGKRRTGFTLMADALPRERWILTAGVLFVVLGGLFPNVIVAQRPAEEETVGKAIRAPRRPTMSYPDRANRIDGPFASISNGFGQHLGRSKGRALA